MCVCQLCVCTNSLPLQVVINHANQLPVSSHHHYLRVKRLPHHTIYGAVVASQKIEHGPLVQLRPIHLAPHAFPWKRRIRQQPHAKQMSSSVAALVSKPLSPPIDGIYLLHTYVHTLSTQLDPYTRKGEDVEALVSHGFL